MPMKDELSNFFEKISISVNIARART